MSKSGAKRHTHKYFRGPSDLWGCGFADCTHVMPTNMRFMMEGRQSICWLCSERFLLTHANLQQIRPLCQDCWLKIQGLGENKHLIIENLIKQKEAEIAKITNLRPKESLAIENKVDDDCMTPSICKNGNIAELCDNCREKLLY